MSVVTPHRAIGIVASAKDPKRAIQDTVGNLNDIEIMGDMVLIGIYIRPAQTKGGIWRPDSNLEEDVWQGKVGLVLKWGPDAFRNPEDGSIYEQHIKVGEWCVFKVGDAWSIEINKAPCRLVRDAAIKMKLKDPTVVI